MHDGVVLPARPMQRRGSCDSLGTRLRSTFVDPAVISWRQNSVASMVSYRVLIIHGVQVKGAVRRVAHAHYDHYVVIKPDSRPDGTAIRDHACVQVYTASRERRCATNCESE